MRRASALAIAIGAYLIVPAAAQFGSIFGELPRPPGGVPGGQAPAPIPNTGRGAPPPQQQQQQGGIQQRQLPPPGGIATTDPAPRAPLTDPAPRAPVRPRGPQPVDTA